MIDTVGQEVEEFEEDAAVINKYRKFRRVGCIKGRLLM